MGLRVLLVEDDLKQSEIVKMVLVKDGHEVSVINDSVKTMEQLESFRPDIILLDLMMPKVDGFTILQNIRENKSLSGIKIIVLSAKSFPNDEARAFELGADSFVVKPYNFDKLREQINSVTKDEMVVKVWGVRGTYPVPQTTFLKYGGNTSCVSVEMSKGRLFIFDAGTGIIGLGDFLLKNLKKHKVNLFISHPHWDHIHGFPFFKPAFVQGNEIAVFGPPNGNISLREVVGGQMKSIYFPITIREFSARLYFKELGEGNFEVDDAKIDTILLNHPGNTLGYRITDKTNGKSVAYVTDTEISPKKMGGSDQHWRDKMVEFLRGADLVFHDSSYFDNEYLGRVGWGHPPISEVLHLAMDAGVKRLCLFHHDPSHDDARVAEKEAFSKKWVADKKLTMEVSAAAENDVFRL